ncbi:hypothetical protein F5Y12DRAFT_773616 [Xylaria sp. FL1777]|nr:hypothetical protein F5Y12DRAFT_773616 [Xylaria sp. FL1777]
MPYVFNCSPHADFCLLVCILPLAEAEIFDEPRIDNVESPLRQNNIGRHLLIRKWRCNALCHLAPRGEEETFCPETS